jgi:unconventional prefoldin RPB5 interactor 1
MGGSRRKGTVTPLNSQFPPEEVHKATKHVQDAIAEKNNDLHRLQAFLNDNNNLINLVQKLPDQLSHDVMASQSLFFVFCFFSFFSITLCIKVS